MTMSPIRDALQFVIGPLHEYTHALQTAHGYAAEAIDGNQMGHSRWTGPRGGERVRQFSFRFSTAI